MITTCLGSAAMQNVDDASATNSLKKTSVTMEHVTESTDDSERIRRDSTSVKSTTAFQFWSSYVGGCGTGRGKRESTSPGSTGQESDKAGEEAPRASLPSAYSSCVAPTTDKVNAIFDRSVDLVCFSVTPSLSEDDPATGPEPVPNKSTTPRVSCSIEVTGRRGHSRTYNVVSKGPRGGNRDPSSTSVQNKGSTDSIDVRRNKEFTSNPSQESEGADGLTPDPTLSIASSGYEDGLTPDPTISLQSSYVPASYSKLNSSEPAQPPVVPQVISSQQRMLPNNPASSDTMTAGTSLRCQPDPSPTFTHYSLLIAKGSVDSDDLFAALSSSTKSGVSAPGLQLPMSSLSATTFLSSPSTTTVDGSDGLQVDVTTSGAEVPVPTSTKSAFSTAISSMSSFSIDESNSKSSNCGTRRQSYIESVRSHDPESKSLKAENATASADATTPSSSLPLAKVKTNRSGVKTDFATMANDRSWIGKARNASIPRGDKEMKIVVVENVLSSEGSGGATEVTAQETISTLHSMDETSSGEISESREGGATQVSRISLPRAGAEKHLALPGADPFEWAYAIWRAKGLISALQSPEVGAPHSSDTLAHSRNQVPKPITQHNRATTQQKENLKDVILVQVHDVRSSRISDSRAQRVTKEDKERTIDGDFSTILQRWRKKSDAHPEPEQDKKAFLPRTEERVEDRELAVHAENQQNADAKNEDQQSDEDLREVWESFESAGSVEPTFHTRDVWSPFIPRPPSPKIKRRTPSPGIRRSPSPLPSSPSPTHHCSQVSSPYTPRASMERPPLPLFGMGMLAADLQIKQAPAMSTTVAATGQASPQVERRNTSASLHDTSDDDLRNEAPEHPLSQAGRMLAGKEPASFVLTPIPKQSVTLPKSNSDYKTAVRTFLHAVEKNDLDILKSYSSQSDGERADKLLAMNKPESACSKEESLKPSIKDRRKPWHDSSLRSFPAARSLRVGEQAHLKRARSSTGPFTSIRTPESEKQQKSDVRERSISLSDLTKDALNVERTTSENASPGQRNEVRKMQLTPDPITVPVVKHLSEHPTERETSSSTARQQKADDGRRVETNATPATMCRSPLTRGREETRLSPGEPLIGKTIQVPSSVKRKSDSTKKKSEFSLNESAESGTWVRLLSLESAGADDSADYEGAETIRFDAAGRAEESHPWRRDMVVRKVNSFDGEFSVRTSLFEESCQCATSAFSGKDELVEFYLPTMGMYVCINATENCMLLLNPVNNLPN
jgi:hypothetical protein